MQPKPAFQLDTVLVFSFGVQSAVVWYSLMGLPDAPPGLRILYAVTVTARYWEIQRSGNLDFCFFGVSIDPRPVTCPDYDIKKDT